MTVLLTAEGFSVLSALKKPLLKKKSFLHCEMFLLSAVDAATMARKMMVPMTKMMTMMKTTPSTPSTMTKSPSSSP